MRMETENTSCLLLVLILMKTIHGQRVADIIKSEKVTPSNSFNRVKVADILSSEVRPTPPFINKKQTYSNKNSSQTIEEDVDSGGGGVVNSALEVPTQTTSSKSINPKITKFYPLITMTDDYNKDIPPIPKQGGPVQVDFYIFVLDIRDINEVEEELTLEYNLQISWKDERLTAWDVNSNEFKKYRKPGEFQVIAASLLDDIWTPDVFIDHVKKMDQHELLATPRSLRLYYKNGGSFRYSGRFSMKIACQMDFHYYPADTQDCRVKFKSYANDNSTVFVTWKEGKEPRMKRVSLPNFAAGIGGALSNKIATSSSKKSTSEYSEIQFIVTLRRDLRFHLIQTYLPSCLFVVISFLTFFVSRESVLECLTLCMTTLLTLTAMFAAVKQNTPTVSYVKGLDIWMVTCIFCVFFTLLEHTVLLKLRTQITEKAQKKADEENSDDTPPTKKKKTKKDKKKNVFGMSSLKKRKNGGSKPSSRPSQEPLSHFYPKAEKIDEEMGGGESSESESDTSPNVKLRRFPQPAPPTSIHLSLSPPSPAHHHHGHHGGNGQFNPPLSPATMAHRMSLTPIHSHNPIMTPEHLLLSPSVTPQFAQLLSKKARKEFNFSRSVEIFFSKLIPLSFLIFNLIYWPWLLIQADYFNDTAFRNTKYVD